MPVNQQFEVGQEVSVILRGGDEVTGTVELFSTDDNRQVLTLRVNENAVMLEFKSGQWIEAEVSEEVEMKEAA